MLNDPNGYDWPGYEMTSMTADQWVENAIDHGWPMPRIAPTTPPDDEALIEPNDMEDDNE